MFESATLDHAIDKASFSAIEEKLREALLNAQFDLADTKSRTILVLVNGMDGAGKGEVLNRLYKWLDVHFLETLAYEEPSQEERQHPVAWRYWRDLPPRGRIGLMIGSWYHLALRERACGALNGVEFDDWLQAINRFEAMLDAEGVTLVKLWLHVDKKRADKRLRKPVKGEADRDPLVIEWGDLDTPREVRKLNEAALRAADITSTEYALWHVIPSTDSRYRDAAIGEILLDAIKDALPTGGRRGSKRTKSPPTLAIPGASKGALPRVSILSSLDLTLTIGEDAYEEELAEARERIRAMTQSKAFRSRGLICVFEGNDAAGKGGVIMRLREALDPRRFRVYPISAPTDEELARPYLWRFWRRILPLGHTSVFDRSWYGRVLVERIEGLCREEDWLRAYGEINDFEDQLVQAGYVVAKFWLSISPEEQLRRFKAREEVPFKRFKLTPDDWRNRDKWSLYEDAVTDMVDRTSTRKAPWTLVEAEDKRFARVKVLKSIARSLGAAL
jgi:polyphosphate:AMP phosphotransferase